MSTPNAQRQAAYRQKHLHDIDGSKDRLSLVIDHHVNLALARLAKLNGMTKTACLEHLILEAQNQHLTGMSVEEQLAYYDAVTV